MCFPGPSAPSLAKEHEHACSCSFVSSWVAFGLGLGLGQEGGDAAKHTWLPGHTERERYYTDWVGSWTCVRGITYLKAMKYMSLYENQNGHGEKCLAQ